MSEEQLRFHSRKNLEERTYITADQRVMIWKTKEQKYGMKTEPYLTLPLKEFKILFKV